MQKNYSLNEDCELIMSANLQAITNHRYANIFPMMNEDDFNRLMEDVRENGLQEPIWLYEGKILDGRNRYKACQELGIAPELRKYQGGDPLKFVMSLNLARRHLNSSQCAFVALEVKRVLAEEAKQKQIAAGGDKSSKSYLMQAIDSKEKALPEKIPEALSLDKHAQNESREKAASLVGGTNARYIQDAEKIEREAPEVKELVMAGTVNMTDAVKLAKLEPAKRAVAVERIKQGESPKDNILHSSDSNEWYTPARYADLAKKVMGDIDLDPASCIAANQFIQAKRIFDIEDDGFSRNWSGRVWLNPPYGRGEDGSNQAAWSKKLIDEYKAGHVTEGMLLVNAATGNKWFADLWEFPICFVDHRIRFISPRGDYSQPTHSNVIVYLGSNEGRFVELFSEIGTVAKRVINE